MYFYYTVVLPLVKDNFLMMKLNHLLTLFCKCGPNCWVHLEWMDQTIWLNLHSQGYRHVMDHFDPEGPWPHFENHCITPTNNLPVEVHLINGLQLLGKISVMWMRICGPANSNVWRCRNTALFSPHRTASTVLPKGSFLVRRFSPSLCAM